MNSIFKYTKNQSEIPVHRLHAVNLVNAETLTIMPYVLAYPIILEHHRIVDLNALSVRNVRLIGLASTWNAKILAQELAV